MNPQVRSWFGPSIASVASHPTVRALIAKWSQISSERDPVLADFWHTADDKLTDSALLFIKGHEDYTYLHHGRYLQERIGFSMQGMNLSQLRTRLREQLFEIYDRCANEFELGYFQSFADFQQDVMLWGRITLPLRVSHSDQRVLLLVFCHPIEDKASVFRSLFERSHHAIIVASPLYDDKRCLLDAWIIGQNRPASLVTGVEEHTRDNLLLRSSPIFANDALWARLAAGLGDGPVSAIVTVNSRNVRYYLFAEMVGENLVVHLADQSQDGETFVID